MAKMTKRGEDEGKHGHSVKLGIKGISPMKGETQKNYDARARKAWALCKKTKDSQGNIKCKGAMHHATKLNYVHNMSGKADFAKGFARKGTEND
tara:strand:+ start:142 stop:423 length:282 start_codon:yes stop_codon:yes gene_type:complete